MRPVCADDDHVNVVVEHGRVQRGVHLIEHLGILCISGFFPCQHDSRDVLARPLVADSLKLGYSLAHWKLQFFLPFTVRPV